MIEYYEKRDVIFEKIKKNVPELADTKLSNQDFSDFKEERKYVRMYPFHLSRRAFFGSLFVLGVIIYLLLRITGIIPKTAITHKDAVLPSSEGLEIVIDDGSTGLGAGLADIDLKENKLGENDYYANSKNRDRKLRYSLPSGDQRHFRLILPDGTWIWVHPNTRIKYPVNFSQDSIHVTVLGKAYFEVNRDSLHPYIIIQPSIVSHLPSATLMIEAVSAHFDVEAYPDSSAMRITVITGKLFIRVDSVAGKQRSELQLFAGQLLEAKDGKINVIQNVDVNKVLTRAKWYDGK
jgi:hypothetical protein